MATETKKRTPAEEAEEKVPRFLFKDGGKYKDDVPVIINGKCYQIQRGKSVMVPPAVAEVLDRSQEQDNATADLIDVHTSRFAAETRARGF